MGALKQGHTGCTRRQSKEAVVGTFLLRTSQWPCSATLLMPTSWPWWLPQCSPSSPENYPNYCSKISFLKEKFCGRVITNHWTAVFLYGYLQGRYLKVMDYGVSENKQWIRCFIKSTLLLYTFQKVLGTSVPPLPPTGTADVFFRRQHIVVYRNVARPTFI